MNVANAWVVPLLLGPAAADRPEPADVSEFVALRGLLGLSGRPWRTWCLHQERKVAAPFQDRIRVGPLGLLQPIANALKLLAKENIVPRTADQFVHILAQSLCSSRHSWSWR